MKTLVNRIVMVAASAMVLGTLAFGQTEMKAQIPFPFRTSMSTLPAGEYTVGQSNQERLADCHAAKPRDRDQSVCAGRHG